MDASSASRGRDRLREAATRGREDGGRCAGRRSAILPCLDPKNAGFLALRCIYGFLKGLAVFLR